MAVFYSDISLHPIAPNYDSSSSVTISIYSLLLVFVKRCMNLLFLPDTLFVANCFLDMLFPQQIKLVRYVVSSTN